VAVVERALTRPLAEDVHILQRIFQLLSHEECIPRQRVVLDWAVGVQCDGRDVAGFQLFGELLGVLCDFGGDAEKRLRRLMCNGAHGRQSLLKCGIREGTLGMIVYYTMDASVHILLGERSAQLVPLLQSSLGLWRAHVSRTCSDRAVEILVVFLHLVVRHCNPIGPEAAGGVG
jgi:hypothetical protein